jgi:hypothetical protein
MRNLVEPPPPLVIDMSILASLLSCHESQWIGGTQQTGVATSHESWPTVCQPDTVVPFVVIAKKATMTQRTT